MTAGVLDTPTISSAPLSLIADGLEANSIDAGRAFAEHGLTRTASADGVIPLSRFAGLLQTAASAADPSPRIWLTGRAIAAPSLGSLFADHRSEPRLGGLLSGIIAELNAIQTGSDFSLGVDADVCTVSYRIVDPSIWPRSRDAEFTLGFFEGVIEAACGLRSGFLDAIAFEHGRDSRGEIARHAGLPPIFEEPTNYLAFPVGLLDAPIVIEPDPKPTAAWAASPPISRAPVGDEVALAIYRRVGQGAVSQERIAEDCGMSERSLRRLLREDGVSFRDLLDRARIAYAQWALAATDLPVSEIANRAGYADQSAFSRAFRRRTGRTPSTFRPAGPAARPHD
ncbi:AraC-like transcriptional regulator QhpR [Amorphus orientalis]|uniref:AraC-like DNA-binding protein n=1 Tax=Amorphus orientalis TaxID=649198 RepID=A0AAE3VNA2_9HYPH|nr:AraC family transcriptional regulator [Amorphus orientalis]MDQ0315095.1 AraC-like DNA-binding protein [Amorphus orientalis]